MAELSQDPIGRYVLKISKREHAFGIPETGEVNYYKEVTVISNGRTNVWKVGLSILGDERAWAQFMRDQIEPFVRATFQ